MLAQKLIGATAQASNATVTYVGASSSASTAYTFTFNNVNIGGPGLIVFLIQGEGGGSNMALGSLTVDGESATIHTTGTETRVVTTISSFRVASGTTANIVLNFLDGDGDLDPPAGVRVSVFRIESNSSDTPIQTLRSYTTTSRTSASIAFNSAGNAVGVFGATSNISGTSFTFTNATEVFDAAVGSGTTAAGATRNLSTATVTVSAACASSIIHLAGVLWR